MPSYLLTALDRERTLIGSIQVMLTAEEDPLMGTTWSSL